MNKKKRVNLLLDAEELEKFKKLTQQRYSNLSREVNLFMHSENLKEEAKNND